MKKLLFILAISFSFAAKSQADPAFTTKAINFVNASKSWYNAGQQSSGSTWDAVESSLSAFFPTSFNAFQSKLQAMYNSPTEMARLTDPIGLVQCLGSSATDYVNCIKNAMIYGNGDEIAYPNPIAQDICKKFLIASVGTCVSIHL